MAGWLDEIRAAKEEAEETLDAKRRAKEAKEADKGKPPKISIAEAKALLMPLFEDVRSELAIPGDDYPRIKEKSYIVPPKNRRSADASYAYYTIEFTLSRVPIKMSAPPVLIVHVDIGKDGWRVVRASAKIVSLPKDIALKFEADEVSKTALREGLKTVIKHFIRNYYELVKKRGG